MKDHSSGQRCTLTGTHLDYELGQGKYKNTIVTLEQKNKSGLWQVKTHDNEIITVPQRILSESQNEA